MAGYAGLCDLRVWLQLFPRASNALAWRSGEGRGPSTLNTPLWEQWGWTQATLGTKDHTVSFSQSYL